MSSGIFALTPFTLQDYPGRCACILWVAGCNMRCGYCHNPQIVLGHAQLSTDEVCSFLEKRAGLLDGLVVSGGEATAWPGLPDLLRYARRLHYAIKLDTNGLRPDVVERLLEDGLLDQVALDYKAPPEKFAAVTGVTAFRHFERTLGLLCARQERLAEIRTTLHTGLLDETDINSIIADLERRDYRGLYAVQNFRADNNRPTLGRLPAQTRQADTRKINRSSAFSVVFRNFAHAGGQEAA